MIDDAPINLLLALVRLGDADRLGWWRSHSVDETAEYVLGQSFPSTWMASGLELAMESARVRHDAHSPATAVHLFSDYLPFHQVAEVLADRAELDRDTEPLRGSQARAGRAFAARSARRTEGERRGDGL